jgi:hypothetical protein
MTTDVKTCSGQLTEETRDRHAEFERLLNYVRSCYGDSLDKDGCKWHREKADEILQQLREPELLSADYLLRLDYLIGDLWMALSWEKVVLVSSLDELYDLVLHADDALHWPIERLYEAERLREENLKSIPASQPTPPPPPMPTNCSEADVIRWKLVYGEQ